MSDAASDGMKWELEQRDKALAQRERSQQAATNRNRILETIIEYCTTKTKSRKASEIRSTLVGLFPETEKKKVDVFLRRLRRQNLSTWASLLLVARFVRGTVSQTLKELSPLHATTTVTGKLSVNHLEIHLTPEAHRLLFGDGRPVEEFLIVVDSEGRLKPILRDKEIPSIP